MFQLFYLLTSAGFTLIWQMLILDPCISHILNILLVFAYPEPIHIQDV